MVEGFLGDATLCRCPIPGASFFSREIWFFGFLAGANGKRIGTEKFCRRRHAFEQQAREIICPASIGSF